MQEPLQAADLWLCQSCGFSPAGNTPTGVDHVDGARFIADMFPDRPWHNGQSVIVCDGHTCLMFTWNGDMMVPSGTTFNDPKVGHANKPQAPSIHAPSGGETGASYSPGSSTVWHPSVVYNPGSHPRTGTVTVTFGSFDGSGGGGGGRFPGANESE
jgi:hypothetical protein